MVNRDRFDISFREFTIKEDIEKIAAEIIQSGSNVVGISVSIWNMERSMRLVNLIKSSSPNMIIIAGGPEVSYDPEYFLSRWEIDYIISGEGEFLLGELLEAIKQGVSRDIDSVSRKGRISSVAAKADLNRLARYPSPYRLEQDREDMGNRIIYFETSRGCPYRCQYCLSSLESGVRYFPRSYILENLNYLLDSSARQIKFLDRTFNLKREHTEVIFRYLIANHREGKSFQFEIYADLLSEETIELLNRELPKDYFRFEIGIQSTYEPTNRAVKRNQNFPILARNIARLMEGERVDLHLDLIAGLPNEGFERFAESFNDVFQLGAKEVQLGILKMLRGTGLRADAERYGYRYREAPPYEVICNSLLSEQELERIHAVSQALDRFWNSGRFRETMQLLIESEYRGRYFQLFDQIGQFYKEQKLPEIGYQLEDLFRNLNRFLELKGIDASDTLRSDYYSCFRIRPNGYWKKIMERDERKRVLSVLIEDREFLNQNSLSGKVVEKQTALYPLSDGSYLLTVFEEQGRRELIYKKPTKNG